MTERAQATGIGRWWVAIVVAATLAAASGFVTSLLLPKSYEASSTLLVGSPVSGGQLDYEQILAATLEAQTFASLATANSTLQETIVRTGLDGTADDLRRRLEVDAPPSSRFVIVTISDAMPRAAADTANAIAATLLLSQADADERETLRDLEAELVELSSQTSDIEAEVEQLRADDPRRPALEEQLADTQRTWAERLQEISAMNANGLVLVDPAVPPREPIAPRPLLNAALAGIAGGAFTLGAALLLGRAGALRVSPPSLRR